MQTKSLQVLRAAGVLSATSLVLVTSQLSAADKTDAFPTFDSYIKVSGQSASISGDGAAYQSRARTGDQLGAGIEDAHYSKDLSKDTTATLDGRALSGSEDYLLSLKLVKNEVGSVDVGYKQFRTFYDGVGGFFPTTGQFSAINQLRGSNGQLLYPDTQKELFVDRGEFWAEVKIARPDSAEVKLRYTNGTRNGKKDSTIWGASDNTGQNFNTANGYVGSVSGAQARMDSPSYLDINERHQTLEGTVKQTVGNTTAEVGLVGDWAEKHNGRFVTKFPGETTGLVGSPTFGILAPAYSLTPNASSVASNWTVFNNQVVQSTYDIEDTRTKGINGSTITELTPKLTMRTGASMQDVTSSFGGDRMLITNAPTAGSLANNQIVATSYDVKNLDGETNVDVYNGKIGFDYKITDSFTASLGAKGETSSAQSDGQYDTVTAAGTVTHKSEHSDVDEKSVTPVMDLRYAGIRNLALYSTVSHKAVEGVEEITPAYTSPGASTLYHSNINENNTDYTVGANWRTCNSLTVRFEPFFKDHDLHSTGYHTGSPGDNYELGSQFWGAKFTAIVKVTDTLTFTNRYIYQKGMMEVTGTGATAPENNSMDSLSHTFGETIDWNPMKQLYLQASADVVFNTISTVYINPDAYNTNSTGIPGSKLVQNSNNNYFTYSLIAGAVITKTDDLQLKFTAYTATNGDSGLAAYTMPYGVSASEYTISLALKHKLSDRCIATGKVGYFDSHNDTTGGNTDFHGPLAYVSLEYGL